MQAFNGFGIPQPLRNEASLQVAAPLNDVQLVCLLAAYLLPHSSDEDEAVEKAQRIVFKAVEKQDALARRIRDHRTNAQ